MKKLYFVSFLLGLICSFGQPPFNYILPSLCSLALFFYFLESLKKTKEVFWFSFLFGYGYCFYSHHWLTESLLAYGDQFLWLLPIGIFFVPAVFAPYFALTGYLINKFAKGNILATAFIWLVCEYFRSYGYIESPWLLIGYIWSDSEVIRQVVSIFGIWGLSYLTILWAGAIHGIIQTFYGKDYFAIICVALLSYIICYSYGYYHLKDSPLTAQKAKVRIIQPNIDNNVFSRMNNRQQNLEKLMFLSQDAGEKEIDYIIWPEGAHEFNVDNQFQMLVKTIIPKDGFLIFNSSRTDKNITKYWNSLFVLNHKGKIVSYYDKMHLVALGEYIPLRRFLPFVNKIAPGSADYSRGTTQKIINVIPPFLPSICYEDAFPEAPPLRYFTWIVNITNDGWFGTSIGPYQHLSIAKFRAIEQGVPMIRAALTGISAIIDSFGNIVHHAPLLTEAVIDSTLPPYITDFTYYRTYGNRCLILLMLFTAYLEKFIQLRIFKPKNIRSNYKINLVKH
ncbi:MAG: apolipoprotein N-acyltransferase [Rickettsiales bacterium]